MSLDAMHRWAGRYHCRAIERVEAVALPCDEPAARVYRDADGTAHGYCLRHTSLGITERARHGWLIPDVEEAAA